MAMHHLRFSELPTAPGFALLLVSGLWSSAAKGQKLHRTEIAGAEHQATGVTYLGGFFCSPHIPVSDTSQNALATTITEFQ